MKKYLLLPLLTLTLVSCSKNDDCAAPVAVAAPFGRDFSLRYQQEAKLETTTQPELSVVFSGAEYSVCPANANCVAPDFVAPTLTISSAGGQTQQLALPLPRVRAYNPAWVDSTSIRANGQRYLVYYVRWNVKNTGSNAPQKKDLSVVLRIEKPQM